ncbi:MAG: YdcF family protein, partial [Myxococcota bacterium]
RLAASCVAAAGLGLTAASSPWVAAPLAAALEGTHGAIPLASLEPADAILVLGGGTQPAVPPRELPELAHAGDRVLHAARLYRAGKAPWVLVAGGRAKGDSTLPSEAETMTAILVELGVPEAAILREDRSTSTRENCVLAKEILDAEGAHDVLLVTSAIHMRRAHATCLAAGLEVRAAPTDFWIAGDGTRGWRAFTPRPEALMLSHVVLHERLGYWVYERRGWIAR